MNFGIRQKKTQDEKVFLERLTNLIKSNLPNGAEDDNVQVIVTEVQCNAPDCVPIETLVILYGTNAKWSGKILRPVAEVREEDVKTLEIPFDWETLVSAQSKFPSASETIEQISPSVNSENWLADMTEYVLTNTNSMTFDKKLAVASYLESLAASIRNNVKHENTPNELKPLNSNVLPMQSNSTLHTIVSMKPRESYVEKKKLENNPMLGRNDFTAPPVRHNKGVRQRGCPCCDPDNIDNIVDNLFLRTPP